MSDDDTFDAIVIGAGPAGEVAAGRLADHGLRTALVERELVGGECSYWACMPSKALLRPGDLLAEVARVPGAREAVTGRLDAAAALARRDEVTHDLDDSAQLPWLEERKVALIRGEARLDGERRVLVGDRALRAERAIVLATGTGASLPPVDGLADARPWTNREITTAHEVPERLLVLGGGVVGVEMAQAWSTLGSDVTLVEVAPRLLGREEDFAAEHVAGGLRGAGVDVRVGVTVTSARREDDGTAVLVLEGGEELRGDELLVAAGRRPHTDDLGLETVGLEPGESVEVDDRLRSTAHDWLFAVGDVNGRALLTHAGKYQAAIAADVVAGHDVRAEADGPRSPRVVFTDPQVAAVGHTLSSAREAGIDAVVVDHPTEGVAGGSFHGKGAEGRSRLVVDRADGTIAGATFTGPDVAEMVHGATIAVVGRVPLARLRHAIPSFPTRSEVWLRLWETAEADGLV